MAGMTFTKTVKQDHMNDLRNILKELRSKKVKIGIFGRESSQILMIASVQEFGCKITITNKMRWWLHHNGLHVKDSTTEIHIPERSFIRKTANEKKDKMDAFIKNNMDKLFNFEMTADQFLNKLGQYLVGLTQETLTNGNYKPNHPWTIERKDGKDTPLIDTGKLRMSITWIVE